MFFCNAPRLHRETKALGCDFGNTIDRIIAIQVAVVVIQMTLWFGTGLETFDVENILILCSSLGWKVRTEMPSDY